VSNKNDEINKTSVSVDKIELEQLKSIFPQFVKDGQIDFTALKAWFSENAELADVDEKYSLGWAGKSKAIQGLRKPATGTLQTDYEESVDWDTTENLFIEGDNLEVLKLLLRKYENKIKMIYIDPPYNTGKDFVYKDNFTEGVSDYYKRTGQDKEGENYSTNSDKSGRYHSDWLSMMYPRLKLARNLLTDDGVIFISIDDNEQSNLKKLCDEIFGEENFIAQIIWERSFSPVNLKKHFSESHDFVLCYARKINISDSNGLARDEDDSRYKNPDNDPRGRWTSSDMTVGPVISSKVYEITLPSGRTISPTSGRCWLYTKKRYQEMVEDNRIWYGENGNNTPRVKKFLSEVKEGIIPVTIWKHQEVGHSQSAAQQLKELFEGHDLFDYPKPVDLIKRLAMLYTTENDIILDFFSGSGTTAQAVMQLNAEDGGNRKHIQVQLPEKTSEDSEAYKAGYKTIPEIARERIRRAGKKIKEDYAEQIAKRETPLDTGFKAFKLTNSNYTHWQNISSEDEDLQTKLLSQAEAEVKKPLINGYKEIDVVYEILLKEGLSLNAGVEKVKHKNIDIYVAADEERKIVVTFADKVESDTHEGLQLNQEDLFVCIDSALTSSAKTNIANNIKLKTI
jgi:adenine-specific DNA-methyltransferase